MIRALALALALAATVPTRAQAHCYSVWSYPKPQAGCVAAVASVARQSAVVHRIRLEPRRSGGDRSFDLPMIDADPATTALRELLQSTWR